jgi:hypothetical protein
MKKDARTIVSVLVVLAGTACGAVAGGVPGLGVIQPLGEGETYGPNGMPQRMDMVAPEWIAPVLEDGFDASFQDMRTDTFIHEEISRVIADGRYVMVMGDPNTRNPKMALCWAADAQPTQEIIDAVNAAIMGSFDERFQIGGSWNGSINTIRNISWSFAPDGITITGGPSADAPNTLFATLDAQFANNGGRAAWINLFQLVFDRWASLTGLSYVRRTASGVEWDDGASWGNGGGTARGDVRIAMKPIDGGGGILAYNQFPGSGNGGDMVLDSGDTWDSTTNSFRFTRNVIAHEHGHGIGLAHVCPQGASAGQYKLMEPFISTAYDGPQQDDVRGAQFNYGDINEPNNVLASATDLGTLASGSTTTLGAVPGTTILSTSTLSVVSRTTAGGGLYTDQDWYKINLATPRLVTYTVNVTGSSYDAGPQTNPCSAGSGPINSRNIHDLRFIVYRSNGTIELANINATAIGANETQASVLVPAGDTYFVVTNDLADATTGTQQYTASIQVQTNNLAPIATNTLTDKVRVSWTLIPNADEYRIRRSTVDNFLSSGSLGSVTPPATQFDDTTAVPGVQYFYWLEVGQTLNSQFIATTAGGVPGLRVPLPNNPPVANAGPDQTVTDSDNSGSETVTLNGSGSTDGDGTIASYTWRLNGNTILTGVSGPVSLPVGASTVELTVIDDDGAPDTDTVLITVNPGQPSGCDGIDFNNDGSFFDPLDIDAFLSVFAEGPCLPSGATCNDIDFNNDTASFDPCDIDSFLLVFAEGPCTPCGQ